MLIRGVKVKIYDASPEVYALWRKALTEEKLNEPKQIEFIHNILQNHKCKTLIDLGGGIGIHTGALAEKGYNVTLLDASSKALKIAKINYPSLDVVQSSFEKIKENRLFDAAICMWTTFPYILKEEGRKSFFGWIRKNVKKVVILDESNFYLLPPKFHQSYSASDGNREITITRDGTITNIGLRKSRYKSEIIDLNKKGKMIIEDEEILQFISIDKLKKYMGNGWTLNKIYGKYHTKSFYEKDKSPRIVTIFIRK